MQSSHDCSLGKLLGVGPGHASSTVVCLIFYPEGPTTTAPTSPATWPCLLYPLPWRPSCCPCWWSWSGPPRATLGTTASPGHPCIFQLSKSSWELDQGQLLQHLLLGHWGDLWDWASGATNGDWTTRLATDFMTCWEPDFFRWLWRKWTILDGCSNFLVKHG